MKRLKQESQDLGKVLPIPGVHSINPLENDLFHWQVFLEGPRNTQYEGGLFEIDIK